MDKEERKKYFLKYAPVVYGRYWKTNVGIHLNYNGRSIRNWIKGAQSPAQEVILLLEVYMRHGYRYRREENVCVRIIEPSYKNR